MVLSDKDKKRYTKRLLLSRMRLLGEHGFYGLLLMHMTYTLETECQTAMTDGKKISFNPSFLDELDDDELDFIMMHEILHVVLRHFMRYGDRDKERFNEACDIVVNSNILRSNGMDTKTITLKKYGESMHLAPNGEEGFKYTAEQVYDMLSKAKAKAKAKGDKGLSGNEKTAWDDHSLWGSFDDEEEEMLGEIWEKRFMFACEAMKEREENSSSGIGSGSGKAGLLPAFAERLYHELRHPQTDWRTLLNDFVQEEITDYSFLPPDRRYGEGDFFLPDFNDTESFVRKILFWVDTSGSMDESMISAAISEVKGAIEQFNGKLSGWIGFFDSSVTAPVPFSDVDELLRIKPIGGGGTSFNVIFRYVREHMSDDPPVSIIVLTDGYCIFPDESASMGIPVLWILNNEEVTPPWGKTARIRPVTSSSEF